MKVLHILGKLLPSGAETMLCSSAKYWDPNLEKHILATANEVGVYAAELEKAGYIIHHIHKTGYWKQHKAVRALIREHKFDVVHEHRQGQAFSYELDAFLAGTRTIVRTVHNVFVFHGPVQIREFITRQMAGLIGVKHISIGKSVHENEWERFRVKCTMIPNWYDENRFYFTTSEQKQAARKQLNIANDAFCIVSVGNCTQVKNHMSILRTLARFRQDPVFRNVRYFHLGHGPQEDEERIFADNQGIAGHVEFVGFADPVVYLQAADLYVMPSTNEGFSIAAIEGVATGIPALFTDVPGLRDLRDVPLPNVTFCPLDDKSVSDAIYMAVCGEGKENSRLQAEAVQNFFGIARGVQQYQQVYFGGQ